MGKDSRKRKTTNVAAVMDVSQSSLGVRTRARTLALQRLLSSATAPGPSLSSKPDYLELRSRRLEKPTLLKKDMQNSRKSSPKQGITSRDEESPQIEISPEKSCPALVFEIGLDKEEGGCFDRKSGGFEIGDLEIEASLGENNLELEARERSTRESTPCSLIRSADAITPPGSSTKQRTSAANLRSQNTVLGNFPTEHEVEEFFAHAEQPMQQLFIEKYNFDIVNDVPLPGRYEWIGVMP